MTEDDTFKKLRGASVEEAQGLYGYYYELGMKDPTIITIADLDNYIDLNLRKYNWTLAQLLDNLVDVEYDI